jgi:hypothetical protein
MCCGEQRGARTGEICSILIARSLGMRLRTGGYVAGRNWQVEWMEFLWTVGDENERNIA